MTHPGTAQLQQVDGLPTNIDIVGNMLEEDGYTVLHFLGNKHVAMCPVKLIYRMTWSSHKTDSNMAHEHPREKH